MEQVDAFLDQAELRLAARESRAAAGRSTVAVEVQRIKITIVYESMFGTSAANLEGWAIWDRLVGNE